MGDLIYNQAARNLKTNPAFPFTWVLFGVMLIVSISMGIEDYTTSYLGYSSFPTQKAIPQVIYMVAALPQLIQMAAIYVAIGLASSQQKDRLFYGFDVLTIMSAVWLIAFMLDGYWDYVYKSAPYVENGIYWQGVLDSYITYGLLSEVLFSFSLGMFVALSKEGAFNELVKVIGDAVAATIKLIKGVIRAVVGQFKANTPSTQSQPQPSRPPQQHQPSRGSPNPRPNHPRNDGDDT